MSRTSVEIRVENADITRSEADLLILKSVDGASGVGVSVARELERHTREFRLPSEGSTEMFKCQGSIKPQHVLFVGLKPVFEIGYRDIREFARHSLQVARNHAVHSPDHQSTSEIVTTIHGPGFGLDEAEAFESQIAGFIDAIEDGTIPPTLDEIRIVEIDEQRAERLQSILDNFLPAHRVSRDQARSTESREVGYASDNKPSAFVAMPFEEEFHDVYQLGIKEPVKSAGYLCERIDEQNFTGSIAEEIKERIESASLVVADMTTANPNVYLEVGYAWGCDVDTVLITQETDDLEFDVQSQNAIIYDRHAVRELREELTETLQALD